MREIVLKLDVEKILKYSVLPSILLISLVIGLNFWDFPTGFF
jgi:type III secretory pathway component EscV